MSSQSRRRQMAKGDRQLEELHMLKKLQRLARPFLSFELESVCQEPKAPEQDAPGQTGKHGQQNAQGNLQPRSHKLKTNRNLPNPDEPRTIHKKRIVRTHAHLLAADHGQGHGHQKAFRKIEHQASRRAQRTSTNLKNRNAQGAHQQRKPNASTIEVGGMGSETLFVKSIPQH